MSFFTTKEIAFGLDISDHKLRLIQLAQKGRNINVQLYNEVDLIPDCLVSGDIKKPEALLSSLKKLTKTVHGKGKLSDEVIVVLPEEKTFLKTIAMPITENKNMDQELKKNLPQHVPINFDNVYIDWQIIKTSDTSQTVLIGSSPKEIVDSYVNILNRANLMPTVVEIEATAIARALIDAKNNQNAQIIIDIGANRTGLFLYDEDTIKFTISLPLSGKQITQLIVDTLDLDWQKAEQAKIVCGLDREKCHGALLEIFTDTINKLENHIKQTMEFYYNNYGSEKKVEKIILCGGGANFINITQILEERLGITTAISNPWERIKNPNPDYFNCHRTQSFITTLGLGLRGLNPETFL
ncbi:MAG TPA: type IV pilus assembly protein PilM [Patescibacteria group bacterium]|nr:type IV pilus assembly protein PilM [Patescibacteria group bacterium]